MKKILKIGIKLFFSLVSLGLTFLLIVAVFFGVKGYQMYQDAIHKTPLNEKVETIPLIVIKKDNNREQYDRTKLEGGVLRACYKRPVAAADIQATIDSIETEIFSREEKEIPSSQIGEIVMESLKKLDPVAYVRFASVYREFKDVNTFMDELKKILE